MQQPLVEHEDTPQPIGDDKVHFDPIRAVQSIKLTNNYRTAQSNDNFLSTVILNTYFFANAVLHHSEINQPPPKLPYDATDHHTSSESSCTSSEDNSDDDGCSSSYTVSTSDDDVTGSTASEDDDDVKISHNNFNASRKHNTLHQKTLSQNIDQIHHASSSPPSHHKSSTLSNICYVPSQVKRRHTANPHKASQILGIDSDAVIFANTQRRYSAKPSQSTDHRKSNSFSNGLLQKVSDDMKIQQIHSEEDCNHVADDEDEMSDDEFVFKQLDFDKFRPQKRNTPTRAIRRSNTVDFGRGAHAKTVIFNEDMFGNVDKRNTRSRHSSLLFGSNNNMSSKPLRRSRRSKGETSDVIEIKFKIDCTKKGYLFIGLIPANKINNVVQNGFMFGFNEYTYSLHGYSGKLYHDKVQSDYYFNPNRKQKDKPKHNKANTVDITSGIAEIANTDNEEEDVLHRASTERKEQEEEEDEEEKTDDRNRRNTFYHNDKHQSNRNLPVLHSGDIVTMQMKLNRNQGKFSVIYCINDVDYGTAWKNIEPGVTIGLTMVGRKEQITLMSCSYKPYKNDKSCVIL